MLFQKYDFIDTISLRLFVKEGEGLAYIYQFANLFICFIRLY